MSCATDMAAISSEKQDFGSNSGGEKGSTMNELWTEKHKLVQDACQRDDLATLVDLATSQGGLLTDEMRRSAWPILLGCQSGTGDLKEKGKNRHWQSLPRHFDEDQVQLDVDRAFVYYPKDQSESSIDRKKAELSDIIVQTLRSHPMLSYFQSYHDVVQVMLLVLGKELASTTVPRVSLLRLRDYMLPTISPARKHFELVSIIVQVADPELASHIAHAENSFALSATHSLFAHDIQDYDKIVRLYDFLLAHEPVMSIYLFAAITISRRRELFEMEADQSDVLTFVISKLPRELDIDALILDAMSLFQRHPPEKLPRLAWWRLSKYSVLKTSRDLQHPQTLQEAEEICQKQINLLRREELMQKRRRWVIKNKRPLASITVAILVGAFSMWLTRHGQTNKVWTMLLSMSRYL